MRPLRQIRSARGVGVRFAGDQAPRCQRLEQPAGLALVHAQPVDHVAELRRLHRRRHAEETPEGRRLHDDILAYARQRNDLMTSFLPADEAHSLLRMMDSLMPAIDATLEQVESAH